MTGVSQRAGINPALRFVAFVMSSMWLTLGVAALDDRRAGPPRPDTPAAAAQVRTRAAESGWPAALPPSSERLAAAGLAESSLLARLEAETRADRATDRAAAVAGLEGLAAVGPPAAAPAPEARAMIPTMVPDSALADLAFSAPDPPRRPKLKLPTSFPTRDAHALKAVLTAVAAIGKPYVWGGTGPSSYDCSGLVWRAWREADVKIPRTSSQQARGGQRVSLKAISPGDLVIYYGGQSHVGIYIGSGLIIHSPHPGTTVQLERVTAMPINSIVRYG
jgi:cell wall-associated NlpC family hydrolase